MEGRMRGEGGKEWLQVTITETGEVKNEVPITEAEMREKTKKVGDEKIRILPLEETLDLGNVEKGVERKDLKN